MNTASVTAKSGPALEGTAAQQELAARVFELMRRQGMLFAADAPIVVPLDKIVQGVSRNYRDVAPDQLRAQVEAALAANPAVFSRNEIAGAVVYETTKSGKRRVADDESRHMFRQRLNAEARPVTEQESRDLIDTVVASVQARGESFTIFQEPAAEAAVSGRWQGPAEIAAFVAPTQPVTEPVPGLGQARELPPLVPQTPSVQMSPPPEPAVLDIGQPTIAMPSAPVEVETPEVAAAPVPLAPELPAEPGLVERLSVVEPVVDVPAPPLAAAAPAPAPVAPAPAPLPEVAPIPPQQRQAPPPPVQRPVRYTFDTPTGPTTVDLNGSLDDIVAEHSTTLETMLANALREDFRFASFGDDWYAEENVERFSKGDFRRIKDYLIETQEALSDRTFLSDILNRRENDPDYERLRFSLNYRMLREKKDFEFVGVPGDRLWIVAGASPVSVPKRKPSEIGTDFRYLEDATIQALEPSVPADLSSVEHALTYYEYENGLLPYDAPLRALLPRPMLEDQRAALLRIEVPLLFQSFPVELRYPTGNRGGYLVGFDAFFQENLVPGATFTLEATDQQNVLVLRYERTGAQEDALLQFDERRSRFVFRPTTFYTATSPDWILSEKRFPRLDGVKRLDEAERKKTEQVVVRAFELVGEDLDGRLLALLSDLLPVVNLERPFSIGALRAVLETGHHAAFAADPDTAGAFFYDPSVK